jgi:hypothetical protein
MNESLSQQVDEVIASLQRAQKQATRLLQAARARRFSFGLDYNYVDVDIERLIARLRYMRIITQRQEERPFEDE